MDSCLRFTRIILICLLVLPWLTAAGEPGSSASQIADGPDWGRGEGIQAHFAQSGHFAAVHASTTDQVIAAIIAANTSNRPTVIHVAPCTYVFNQTFGSDFGSSVLPPITTTILVIGKDAATTIFDGQGGATFNGRAFTVLEGGHLLVRHLTLQNFLLFCFLLDDCAFTGGAALENAGGDVRVESSVVSGNSMQMELGFGTLGGGIFNQSGRMEIEHTTVTHNSNISVGGAGVAVTGGTVWIRHSTLSENHTVAGCCSPGTRSLGGGLYAISAKVWVSGSTITGNTTSDECDCYAKELGSGSGIYNNGEMWVTDSAITQNVGFDTGHGGGIQNSGRMVVVNSTIAGNRAGSGGGGIFNFADLTLQGVTVTNNATLGNEADLGNECSLPQDDTHNPECDVGGAGVGMDIAATTRIADSVIAGNTAGGNCYGALISAGHNAIGSDSSCTLEPASSTDLLSVDPLFGVLTDDGPPGNAHYPLLVDSPLIDAGGEPGHFCTHHDQIGNPRVNAEHPHHGEPRCDIGAIEFQP